MQQLNGIQLAPKVGTDFNTQYNIPDTGLTNNTTLSKSSPLYNLLQVMFNGTEVNRTPEHSNSNIFLNNGLKQNLSAGDHKLFLQG